MSPGRRHDDVRRRPIRIGAQPYHLREGMVSPPPIESLAALLARRSGPRVEINHSRRRGDGRRSSRSSST